MEREEVELVARRLSALAAALLISAFVAAKDRPLVGIVLYQEATGPAYVQISDLLLNGKREVYQCNGTESLDNNGYHNLQKLPLRTGMVLSRDAKGVITLDDSGTQSCALPANLKLGKQPLSLKELGDMSRIDGRVIGHSTNAGPTPPTTLLPGMAIYFVTDADVEYAEFLRARRTQTIPVWNEYIRAYASSSHSAEARKALADLLCGQGETELSAYRKSVSDHAPDFTRLKNAKAAADDAGKTVSSFPRAQKLEYEITGELQTVLAGARSDLTAYLTALNEHKPGYEHLKNAHAQIANVLAVDPQFPATNKLDSEITNQTQALETASSTGEGLLASKRYDEAYGAVSRYKDMATELPRVSAIIAAAFGFHRERGNEALGQSQWEKAIFEFRQALAYRADPDTSAAMSKAQSQLDAIEDQAAATRAMADAKALAAQKKYIEAYELLDGLSDSRRALVKEQLDGLRADYVKDLVTHATVLRRVHTPIRGHADEDGARQAHDYLERATNLAEDQSLRIQLDLLNSAISNYYLAQAKRVLEKPRGSGVGLGWLLLQQARRFKPENESVRDQLTRYAPEYEDRAKLSISVLFRDQTSLRDSLGFAGQLENAVAAGLENAGLPGVKILTREDRQPGTAEISDMPGSEADANYLIHGNILQHHVERSIESASLASHYRSGQREVKNPAWLEAKRAVEADQQDYNHAVDAQTAAGAHGKKKEQAEMNKNVEALGAKLRDAQSKLDSISETLLQDVISPYNYVKRTIKLNAIVEVSFRLDDPLAQAGGKGELARVEVPKTVVVLENVKPEDSDGIVEEGVPPDETQLLQEAENSVKELMLKKMIAQLNQLPPQILVQARDAASRSDTEEAAAKYILYLNSTPEKETTERTEAHEFLRTQFSISDFGNPQ